MTTPPSLHQFLPANEPFLVCMNDEGVQVLEHAAEQPPCKLKFPEAKEDSFPQRAPYHAGMEISFLAVLFHFF